MMERAEELSVQLLDEEAWERGEMVLVGRSVPVSVWLAKLAEWRMTLSLPPLSRIMGGMYDGGHVLVGTGDTRLAFAVPKATLPLLRDWLTEREYGEIVRRIGR